MSMDSHDMSRDRILDLCRESLLTEAEAIAGYARTISDEFLVALDLLVSAQDPVVVVGVGKSGHIARKVASTFRSIGKPAVFLHAAEASHGDLGLIGARSTVLILSNSGETPELSDTLRFCEVHRIPIVAVTSSADSTLGKMATVVLGYGKVKETCPNGLTPTTSTALTLAIGDALAIALTHLLGTSPEDFRRYHPGGKLGARLLRVADLMHTGDALPIVAPQTSMRDVVITMSSKGFGVALVVSQNKMLGIITDGDMRRHAEQFWQLNAIDLIIGKPQGIAVGALASEALEMMNKGGITCLVAEAEDGDLVGLVHIHDCLRAGVGV